MMQCCNLAGHEYTWTNLKFIDSLYTDSAKDGGIEIRVSSDIVFGNEGSVLLFLYRINCTGYLNNEKED